MNKLLVSVAALSLIAGCSDKGADHDGDGKITRLRRECPAEQCGAGVFMASHFDRQYVTLAAPVPLSSLCDSREYT